MRTLSTGICILMAALVATTAVADEKIKLRLNLKKGEVRTLTVDMDIDTVVPQPQGEIEMKMHTGMVMSTKVKDVTADGIHSLDFTFDRMKFRMAGGPFKLDFDSKRDAPDSSPFAKELSKMIGKTVYTKFTARGEAKEVDAQALKGGGPAKGLEGQFGQMMATFPEKAVGIGDSWEVTNKQNAGQIPVTMKVKYTLVERKNGQATIKIDGKVTSALALSGKMQGKMRVDEKTGWQTGGNVDMELSGKVQGKDISMEMKTTFGSGK